VAIIRFHICYSAFAEPSPSPSNDKASQLEVSKSLSYGRVRFCAGVNL
jgi:hypothetical protein